MGALNRTELGTQIDSVFVPTLQIADHNAYLKDPQAASLVFRKDVIGSETVVGGAVTANYSNKDLATVTTTGNLTVSFLNLVNGETKKLAITKLATNTINFSGAIDVSARKDFIDKQVTYVVYEVKYINSVIIVNSINIDNDVSSGGSYEILDIGTWDMNTTQIKNISYSLPSGKAITGYATSIMSNDGTRYWPLDSWDYNASDGTLNGAVVGLKTLTSSGLTLIRKNGGYFATSEFFSGTLVNRGYVTIFYKDI